MTAQPAAIAAPSLPQVKHRVSTVDGVRIFYREAGPTPCRSRASTSIRAGKALGYRDSQSGCFCGIFPQPDHVRLLFEHGAALPVTDRILTGATRQVRYVEVRDPNAIPVGSVQRLLRAALIHGAI